MLVNAKEMILKAKAGKYAIAQININNLEWTKAALETVQELNSPVILGVTSGAAKWMGGWNAVVGMVNGLMKDLKITVPVALHLDHGGAIEICKEAIDAGFTSVMYDGSHDSIEKNVEDTRTVVEYAAKANVSVEAEVGTVGGTEDGVTGGVNYASLDECVSIAETGIDFLAASLGSVHGNYVGEPKLGFKEMVQYSKKTDLPLVLHGGSGIPDDMIKKAISSGQSKINVNTEVQQAFSAGIRKYIEEEKDQSGTGYDPRKVIGTYAYNNMKEVIKRKIELFGSIDKA
ncbi:MAG: fructose-1,6-bisphosphate aldolase, class II [Candidatus Tyloplasma litorale]|nr:MAG: fructose-1,6-bisphosphate aldolase, class II [Mycoplasmatales bacterium]